MRIGGSCTLWHQPLLCPCKLHCSLSEGTEKLLQSFLQKSSLPKYSSSTQEEEYLLTHSKHDRINLGEWVHCPYLILTKKCSVDGKGHKHFSKSVRQGNTVSENNHIHGLEEGKNMITYTQLAYFFPHLPFPTRIVYYIIIQISVICSFFLYTLQRAKRIFGLGKQGRSIVFQNLKPPPLLPWL